MDMSARSFRCLLNVWLAIAGTGVTVTYIADDFTEMRTRLRLGVRTFNAFGTIFGGSLYASTDPCYTLLLVKQLGPEYVVWDKSATIRFVKPAASTVYGHFLVSPSEASETKALADAEGSCTRTYSVDLVDGDVCATIEKTVYVARKDHHKSRQR